MTPQGSKQAVCPGLDESEALRFASLLLGAEAKSRKAELVEDCKLLLEGLDALAASHCKDGKFGKDDVKPSQAGDPETAFALLQGYGLQELTVQALEGKPKAKKPAK